MKTYHKLRQPNLYMIKQSEKIIRSSRHNILCVQPTAFYRATRSRVMQRNQIETPCAKIIILAILCGKKSLNFIFIHRTVVEVLKVMNCARQKIYIFGKLMAYRILWQAQKHRLSEVFFVIKLPAVYFKKTLRKILTNSKKFFGISRKFQNLFS